MYTRVIVPCSLEKNPKLYKYKHKKFYLQSDRFTNNEHILIDIDKCIVSSSNVQHFDVVHLFRFLYLFLSCLPNVASFSGLFFFFFFLWIVHS